MTSHPLDSSTPANPASFLGFGFHIYGRTELAAGITSAVLTTAHNTTSSNATGLNYTRGGYTSRTQVEEAFKTEVDVDYDGIVFSGEFDASYSAASRDDGSSAYGLADLIAPVKVVALTNVGDDQWASGFTCDPDVGTLPDTFNDHTKAQFFRVLAKYGTHLVSEITLGGRLRAVSYADDTAHYSAAQAAAYMSYEYDGFFASSSGSGSASWQKVDQSWLSTRSFQMTALGGDPSLVPVGDHAYDDTFDPAAWVASVQTAPSVATFRLRPLSVVFSGPTQKAMELAIDEFLSNTVQLVIDTDAAQSYAAIGINRLPAPEPSNGPEQFAWLWVLLLDKADGSVVLNKRFVAVDVPNVLSLVDDAVGAALETHPDLVVAFGGQWGWGVRQVVPPSLTALAERNGFNLTSEFHGVGGFNMCYVGSTSRHDPYAVTTSGGRCSNTVNVNCDPQAVIDQDGHVW